MFDFQFQSIVKAASLPKDVRTALFGQIYMYINLIGLVIHLFVTRFALKKFGTWAGLLPVPILGIFSAIWLYHCPNLDSVILIWSISGGITYSLLQVSKETMYVPLTRIEKYCSKAYIDTFIYRSGDAIASLCIIVHTVFGLVASKTLLGLNILGCILWLLVIRHLRKDKKI